MRWSDSSSSAKGYKWNRQENQTTKESPIFTNGVAHSFTVVKQQPQQTEPQPNTRSAAKKNISTEIGVQASGQLDSNNALNHNTANHNTANHNTANHNTANHNTANHNTANHNTAKEMNPHDIWQRVLGELETQLPPSTFNTWVRDTRVYAYEDGEFIICVANAYASDWLQNRLRSMIKRGLTALIGRQAQVQFKVCAKPIDDTNTTMATPLYDSPIQDSSTELIAAATIQPPLSQPERAKMERIPPIKHAPLLPSLTLGRQALVQTGLNPSYTFDTFIVGKHNQLANAAALSIVDKPGASFNPLFVYGGVGLGKTHLLHAVGNRLYQRGYRTLYCTSEQFTNDLISAIRSQTTDEFRNKYRELDLLLIDDIQFIGGKDSTQEEFFHTFNHLFNSGKQVVISSDKVPRAVPTLENRLRSRFEGGLQVDVSMPDFETRVAILESKSRERDLNVGLEVLKEIAGRVESNVRELEGALNQVALQAELLNNRPDIGLARTILDSLSPQKTPCAPTRVIECVAQHYKVASSDITGARRTKDLAQARHVAMFLLRTLNGLSLPVIGQHLGDRDHTTVSHGIERIKKQMSKDDSLSRDLLVLRDKVYSTYH